MTTITVSGPVFAPNVDSRIRDAARSGLFDVAVEITGGVQEQLYAGHGWVTGRLRGSIGARQFSDLGFEVRSGALTGEPVKYAYWIETGRKRGAQTRFGGYHMFYNTWKKWQSNSSRIEKIMSKAVMRVLT